MEVPDEAPQTNWFLCSRVAALGDIRLQVKGRILGDPLKQDEFKLSVLGNVQLPTGDGENFFSSPGVPFFVGLAAAMPYQKLSFGGNVGFSSHPAVTIGDVTLSQDIRFGAGVSYEVIERVVALGERLRSTRGARGMFRQRFAWGEG